MSFRTHTRTFIYDKFVDFRAEFSRLSEGLKSPWEQGDERLGLEAGMELVFKKVICRPRNNSVITGCQ